VSGIEDTREREREREPLDENEREEHGLERR
jgi:hypothetical protein